MFASLCIHALCHVNLQGGIYFPQLVGMGWHCDFF